MEELTKLKAKIDTELSKPKAVTATTEGALTSNDFEMINLPSLDEEPKARSFVDTPTACLTLTPSEQQ